MQGLLLPVLMFAALGLMMYFGMRKQKRQSAEAQKLQNSIAVGARIMTTSGLHGTVTAVADDTIELEIAPDVRTTWVRAAVREVIVPAVGDDEFDDDATESDEFDDVDDDFDEEFEGEFDDNFDGDFDDDTDDDTDDDDVDDGAVAEEDNEARQSDVG